MVAASRTRSSGSVPSTSERAAPSEYSHGNSAQWGDRPDTGQQRKLADGYGLAADPMADREHHQHGRQWKLRTPGVRVTDLYGGGEATQARVMGGDMVARQCTGSTTITGWSGMAPQARNQQKEKEWNGMDGLTGMEWNGSDLSGVDLRSYGSGCGTGGDDDGLSAAVCGGATGT